MPVAGQEHKLTSQATMFISELIAKGVISKFHECLEGIIQR